MEALSITEPCKKLENQTNGSKTDWNQIHLQSTGANRIFENTNTITSRLGLGKIEANQHGRDTNQIGKKTRTRNKSMDSDPRTNPAIYTPAELALADLRRTRRRCRAQAAPNGLPNPPQVAACPIQDWDVHGTHCLPYRKESGQVQVVLCKMDNTNLR
jgi:hypothetical protein